MEWAERVLRLNDSVDNFLRSNRPQTTGDKLTAIGFGSNLGLILAAPLGKAAVELFDLNPNIVVNSASFFHIGFDAITAAGFLKTMIEPDCWWKRKAEQQSRKIDRWWDNFWNR